MTEQEMNLAMEQCQKQKAIRRLIHEFKKWIDFWSDSRNSASGDVVLGVQMNATISRELTRQMANACMPIMKSELARLIKEADEMPLIPTEGTIRDVTIRVVIEPQTSKDGPNWPKML